MEKAVILWSTNPEAMFIKRILTYLNPATMFQKSEHNFNTRMMHGINRISIFVFLFCLVVMLIKFL